MGRSPTEAQGLDVFSSLLLTSTLEKDLAGLDEKALASFVREAFGHLMLKPRQRHAINFSVSSLLAGSEGPSTVLGILNDDMPFVVESVISELHAQGLIPRLV